VPKEYTNVLKLLAPLLCAATLFAEGEIRVSVFDSTGAPTPASGTLNARRFTTDAKGTATLSRLPNGAYTLNVSRPGFASQTTVVNIVDEKPFALTVTLRLAVANSAIDVVDATPLPGINLNRNEVPTPVQTASAQDLTNTNALDLTDLLNRRLRGVHINEMQGNPVQPDLNYRGYTASPLLGTPQGVSIYMDGVRLNQPFGDVVSWDLIPRIAIAETVFMPGSNPLFGLNTLGGALSIHTKSGKTQPGTALQVTGGSFGRKMADFEHGGSLANGMHWYAAGNLFFEDGWRESSPSNVRQLFTKLGQQMEKTSVSLAVSYANNALNGNGLGEQRELARRYNSVYTKPDINTNRSPFLNFTASHTASNQLIFSGNVYYRHIANTAFNGDMNENSLDQSVYQSSAADIRALTAAGYSGFPTSGATAANTPFPFWRCIAQTLQKDEPAEKCNGLINRARTAQHNYGASGQLTWFTPRSQLTAGTAFDRSSVDFHQMSQLGYLNPDRSVTGVNAYGDGVSGGTVDGEPYDTRVDLGGKIRTASVYATDKFTLGKTWILTLSGRYNHTRIENQDRIRPVAGQGSLTGEHSFGRFNPAAGLTYSPTKMWNFYFSYSEGSRAPTSIELGCADPNEPCKLPNSMAGDPPLKQVVTRSWDAGVRGTLETNWNWSAGWFRADNWNDILFVASPQSGYGYFKNFGRTRRQGAEFDLNGRVGQVSMGTGYTFLDATYQSAETVNGQSNSLGSNRIVPGNRIPMTPQHLLKAYADINATKKLVVTLGAVVISSSYARGDENNQHQPDGRLFLGSGESPGYGVANLGGRYMVHRRLEFFVQINNLFDRRYYTAAQLGPTGFTAQGNYIARPFPPVNGNYDVQHATFLAPGAPRGIWGGMRVRF
jgi:outer membrane receptor protein involved in Fe transport